MDAIDFFLDNIAIYLVAVLLGLFPAFAAHRKGYNFFLWWFLGAMVFILALPIALFMKPNPNAAEKIAARAGMKKCPNCAEFVKGEAKVCRFCGQSFYQETIACPLCKAPIKLAILTNGANRCPGCAGVFNVEK